MSIADLFPKKKDEPSAVQTQPPSTTSEPVKQEPVSTPVASTPIVSTPSAPTSEPAPRASQSGLLGMLNEAPKPPAPIANPLLSQGISIFSKGSSESVVQALPKMPDSFDMEPEKPSTLRYITIFGGKNSSKTTTALSFPGRIVVLSFDHKTVPTWITMFNGDPRIVIYDATKYMDYSSPDASLISADITFKYIYALLDMVKSRSEEEKCDWIMIDGLEEYLKICESVMRWRNGLKMTQGVEWQYWKDRSLYIKQLYLKLASLVNRGVIFCTKYDFEEVVISGVTKEKIKKPKWLDIIETQTDIQIETWSSEDKQSGVVTFEAHVTASKYADFPTGRKANVTAKPGKVMAFYQLTTYSPPSKPEEVKQNV